MNSPFSGPENDKTYRMPGDLSWWERKQLLFISRRIVSLPNGEFSGRLSSGSAHATVEHFADGSSLRVSHLIADLQLLRDTSVDISWNDYGEMDVPYVVARQSNESMASWHDVDTTENIYSSGALPRDNTLALRRIFPAILIATKLGPEATEQP